MEPKTHAITSFRVTPAGIGESSLAGALSAIAEIRKSGKKHPITITLSEGIYKITEPIIIDESMSYTTLEGDGEVTVVGGHRFVGWQKDEYNGVPCLSVQVPDGMDFSDLYVNGLRANMTRYPENGVLYAESVERPGERLRDGSRWFIAKEGDFPEFRNFNDCFISYNHYWVDEHSPIESYDPETRRVTMKYRSCYRIDGDPSTPSAIAYYIENVAETFSKPNEWYFDRTVGRVYYIPRDESITLESVDAYAPSVEAFLRIRGSRDAHVTDVNIKNITFAYSRGDYPAPSLVAKVGAENLTACNGQSMNNADGTVTFEYAEYCTVSGCTLRNIGAHGFFIGKATNRVRIEDTVVTDGGMGGVRMSGSGTAGDPADHCRSHTVTRCRFTGLGRRFYSSCGVLAMDAYDCEISHTEISDLYYSAISVGWNWGYGPTVSHHNRILNNHIYGLGKGKLSDMGGIYTLGRQIGTVVSGNVIHGIKSANYGGWAIYLDEGSSGMTVEGNLCYDVSENCFHLHYGADNTVRRNIFAFAEEAAMRITRDDPHFNAVFEDNLVLLAGAPAFRLMHRENVGSEIASAHGNRYIDAGEIHMITDVIRARRQTVTAEECAALGFDSDAEFIADPFVDSKNRDFRLKYPLAGIKDIPIPKTGPYCLK